MKCRFELGLLDKLVSKVVGRKVGQLRYLSWVSWLSFSAAHLTPVQCAQQRDNKWYSCRRCTGLYTHINMIAYCSLHCTVIRRAKKWKWHPFQRIKWSANDQFLHCLKIQTKSTHWFELSLGLVGVVGVNWPLSDPSSYRFISNLDFYARKQLLF